MAGTSPSKEKVRTMKNDFMVRTLAGAASRLIVEAFHNLCDLMAL